MDELCHEVLLANRQNIIRSADPNDVFLNRFLDHLLSTQCLQRDQMELVKRETVSRGRCGKLLDFVSSEGCQAFLELCNALDDFGTVNSKAIAVSMRTSLEANKQFEKMKEIKRMKAIVMCYNIRPMYYNNIVCYDFRWERESKPITSIIMNDSIYWIVLDAQRSHADSYFHSMHSSACRA